MASLPKPYTDQDGDTVAPVRGGWPFRGSVRKSLSSMASDGFKLSWKEEKRLLKSLFIIKADLDAWVEFHSRLVKASPFH